MKIIISIVMMIALLLGLIAIVIGNGIGWLTPQYPYSTKLNISDNGRVIRVTDGERLVVILPDDYEYSSSGQVLFITQEKQKIRFIDRETGNVVHLFTVVDSGQVVFKRSNAENQYFKVSVKHDKIANR